MIALVAMKKWHFVIVSLFIAVCVVAGVFFYYASNPWGFTREVPSKEAQLRMDIISSAEKYLGYQESDESHRIVIDIYNSHLPLAQDYTMSYEDSWCAAFVSAIAIQCKLTDIIPTECGCERQIELFRGLGCWEEKDSYIPLPGDIIYYVWDEKFSFGDCSGWSDHVGIVIGTAGPIIKVIEGNKDDQVAYRYIAINHPDIRGFGLPDYASISE